MSGFGRTIYVSGAGIAGLSLALALGKFGATVVVLERSTGIQEIGAGLQISPNARGVLNQLGLERQIDTHSFEPKGVEIFSFRAQQPLVTLTLGDRVRERYGAPYSVMHRADLAQVLHRACRRFANIDILFGVGRVDVESHAKGVSLTIEEVGGKSRAVRGFAFAGADGVNSPTRTEILGGAAARYSGYVAWRATLTMEELGDVVSKEQTTLLLAPGYHAVCYPLPQRKRINVVLVAREKTASASDLPRNPRLPWAMLRSPRFDAIIEAAKENWGYWPLMTVPEGPWHRGAVGLLGDAAHAMLPFQAQGAAMAIEDAAILAPLLMTEPNGESAFARFHAMRRERVRRVAQTSRLNGIAFHAEWPFTIFRDAALLLRGGDRHLNRLDWLYGFDPAPEVNTAIPVGA